MFCIASGPSLTAEDCEIVRLSGIETIAVNHSWKLAPFCKHIYAGDAVWWEKYGHEINIPVQKWTCSRRAAVRYGLNYHCRHGECNTGLRAIELAIEKRHTVILLLGYDCTTRKGAHWHGPHTATTNPDEAKCKKWKQQFARVAKVAKARGVRIINCSRDTALTCFPRLPLEAAIGEYHEATGRYRNG